jgi:hypothetical protein
LHIDEDEGGETLGEDDDDDDSNNNTTNDVALAEMTESRTSSSRKSFVPFPATIPAQAHAYHYCTVPKSRALPCPAPYCQESAHGVGAGA